jgi:hypothetical protein
MAPPAVRAANLRAVRDGTLDDGSPVTDARGIGPYLEGRLRRAFAGRQRGGVLRVGELWHAARRLDDDALDRVLRRALQNERANQCVAAARGDASPRTKYHAADVNPLGHHAVLALLAADPRPGRRRRRGALSPPRHRSAAAGRCGCRPPGAPCGRACVRAADGTCVPRARSARGFVGAPPRADQKTTRPSSAAARAAARSPAVRRDRDAAADLRAGHARDARYTTARRRANKQGGVHWRVPGPLVRLPVVRR